MFLFSRRSRLLAPTRARFDSPRRLALGWAEGMNEKPQRGEIPAFKPRRRAPGISPLWGWAVLCTTLPRVTNSLRIGAPPWAVESRPIRGWLIVCGNKTGIHSDEPNAGVLRSLGSFLPLGSLELRVFSWDGWHPLPKNDPCH